MRSDTVSQRRPGSVSTPDDTRAGLGFRHRQGQMTRMPLSLSQGGRLFKKGPLSRAEGACLRASKRRRRLSAAQLRRGLLILVLTRRRSGGHDSRQAVPAHSDLPTAFINPFCSSSAAAATRRRLHKHWREHGTWRRLTRPKRVNLTVYMLKE